MQNNLETQNFTISCFQVTVIRSKDSLISYLLQFNQDQNKIDLNNLRILCSCEFDNIYAQITKRVKDSKQYERSALIFLANRSHQGNNFVNQMFYNGLKTLFSLMVLKNIYTNVDLFRLQKTNRVKRELVFKFIQQLIQYNKSIPAVLHGAQLTLKQAQQQQNTQQNSKQVYTLITGGSRGIGKDIAQLFAKQGKNLIITGRPKNKQLAQFGIYLQQKYKVNVLSLYLDISQEESCIQFADKLAAKSYQIQAVIFNAGVGTKTSLQQTNENSSQGDVLIKVNTIGPVILLQKLEKKNLISKRTQIFIVSSVMALRGFKQFLPLDIISKTSLQPWFEYLKQIYNTIIIYPGCVETEMLRQSTLNPKKAQNKLQQFIENLPKRFVIQPDQMAHIINMFCKKQFRDYLRGNKIAACCGLHVDYKPL